MKNFILVLLLSLMASCAMGPLNGHETARTVGDGRHELIGGYGTASYFGKWTYGLSQNFDFGVHVESLSIGARLKYALLNPKDGGVALALAGGAGASVGGNYYNGDIIISSLSGRFEPYAIFRYNHVTTDKYDFKDKDTGALHFTIDETNFSYGQLFLGTRIWLSQGFALSVEASKLIRFEKAEFSDIVIFSGALIFRF